MADRDLSRVLVPPPPPADPAALAKEAELWDRVLAAMGDESPHKEYVGFVLKNNLVKNGSRRYGEVVEAKDRFSVEQRRVARQYQQHLVRMLFFFKPSEKPNPRLRGLRAIGLFLATVAMLAGIGAFLFDQGEQPSAGVALVKTGLPIGAVILIVVIWWSIRSARRGPNDLPS